MWSFFCFWSIKKVYIICYILTQIPHLGKKLASHIWAEMLFVNKIAGFLIQLPCW